MAVVRQPLGEQENRGPQDGLIWAAPRAAKRLAETPKDRSTMVDEDASPSTPATNRWRRTWLDRTSRLHQPADRSQLRSRALTASRGINPANPGGLARAGHQKRHHRCCAQTWSQCPAAVAAQFAEARPQHCTQQVAIRTVTHRRSRGRGCGHGMVMRAADAHPWQQQQQTSQESTGGTLQWGQIGDQHAAETPAPATPQATASSAITPCVEPCAGDRSGW